MYRRKIPSRQTLNSICSIDELLSEEILTKDKENLIFLKFRNIIRDTMERGNFGESRVELNKYYKKNAFSKKVIQKFIQRTFNDLLNLPPIESGTFYPAALFKNEPLMFDSALMPNKKLARVPSSYHNGFLQIFVTGERLITYMECIDNKLSDLLRDLESPEKNEVDVSRCETLLSRIEGMMFTVLCRVNDMMRQIEVDANTEPGSTECHECFEQYEARLPSLKEKIEAINNAASSNKSEENGAASSEKSEEYVTANTSEEAQQRPIYTMHM